MKLSEDIELWMLLSAMYRQHVTLLAHIYVTCEGDIQLIHEQTFPSLPNCSLNDPLHCQSLMSCSVCVCVPEQDLLQNFF